MSNTTNLIKDLRTKTGAGFLDCKNALAETKNDVDLAIEYLRKKGLAKASKKSSREANEGAVGIYSNDKIVIIIKVNSETDFAAKSETFLDFIDELGNIAINENSLNLNKDSFLKINYKDNLVSEYINNMIAKIGENIVLNEIKVLSKNDNNFSYYIHNAYKNNVGKLISYVTFQSKSDDDKISKLSKNLCMHIAAMKPESLDIDDLDNKLIENEKNIQKELILSSGKPANIVEKILEGKMKKFYSEVTFLNQTFILDQDKSVKDILNEYKAEYEFKLSSFGLISL